MNLTKANIKSLERIVGRIGSAAPQTKPASLPLRITTALAGQILTGVISASVALFVFSFQADRQATEWRRQNTIDYKTKTINEKSEILRSLRRDVVRYANFDAQTSIETNMRSVRVAMRIAIPEAGQNMLSELSEIPSQDQNKEQREIFSSMVSTATLVRVYFGKKIADDLEMAISIVSNYPNNTIDAFQLAGLLKHEAAKGSLDQAKLYSRLKPRILAPNLPRGLFDDVFRQMVENIEKDIRDRHNSTD